MIQEEYVDQVSGLSDKEGKSATWNCPSFPLVPSWAALRALMDLLIF